jgi:hypothetical protein
MLGLIKARAPEWRAVLRWIVHSWRRPGGAAAHWEQAAGHGRASGRAVPVQGQGAAVPNPHQRPGANTGASR